METLNMKNIFKYLILLGIAALYAVSCQTVPPDNSHVDPAKDAEAHPIPGLTIAVSVTADDAATVTVTADGPAAYITILVDPYDEDQSALLDPATLYACGYESVACQTFKYDSSNPASLPLTDLDPNTTYQVYAVTASTTGVVGDIVNANFLTTDHAIPEADIDNFESLGALVALEFSEDVTYDETKPATAKYYAYNNIRVDASGAITNPGLVGDAHVDVVYAQGEDGKDVKSVIIFSVTLDGENPLPDGACYAISYPAGAFVDAVGNACEALVSEPALDDTGAWAPDGLGGRLATKAFELVDDDADAEVTLVSTASFSFSAPEGVTFGRYTKAAAASAKLVHKEGNAKTSTDYALVVNQDWGLVSVTAGVVSNPALGVAVPGDELSYAIAKGSIEDIYGNSNAELSHNYIITYGYTEDDVIGTYEISGASAYGATYDEADWHLVIEASDNAEKGNVMITCFYDFDLSAAPVYCDWDGDKGIFTAPAYFPLGASITGPYGALYYDWSAFTESYMKYLLSEGSQGANEPEVTLQMPVSGTFESISDIWGYYFEAYSLPASGDPADMEAWTDDDWDDAYLGYDYNMFEIVPVTKAAAAPAPAPIQKQSIKIKKISNDTRAFRNRSFKANK